MIRTVLILIVFATAPAAAAAMSFTCSMNSAEMTSGKFEFSIDDARRNVQFELGSEVGVDVYNQEVVAGLVSDRWLLYGGFRYEFHRLTGEFYRGFQLSGGIYVEHGKCHPEDPKPVS